MKPKLTSACISRILDELAELDSKLSSGGVYAADRDLIFSKILFPAIKDQGYRITFNKGGEYAYFSPKTDGDGAYMYLETVSKIKIRVFGNRHLVDRHVHHNSRWDEKSMGRLISKLWVDARHNDAALVLIVGYDSVIEPFRNEFRELEPAQGWESRGINAHYRAWRDPHNRGFFTCACAWSRREEQSEPTAQSGRVFSP